MCILPLALHAETVKIGVIIPLTGNQAVFGLDARRTINILAPDGFLHRGDYSFQFLVEDGQCGIGNRATSAAKKLINVDGVKFLVPGCSGEAFQAGPLAEKANVLSICFACGHPDIRELGEFNFRTYADLNKAVHLIAKLMKEESRGGVAVLTEESSFTLGIKDELLKVLGIDATFYEDFHVDEVSFQSLLVKARANKPGAYYLNTAGPRTYQNLYRQLRQLGIKEPVYSYHSPADSDVISSLGSAQDGVKFVAVPEVDTGSPEFEIFLETFRDLYVDGPQIDFLLRSSYDAIMSIIQAVEAVGPDPKLARDFLHTLETEGAVGRLAFDSHGDVKDISYTLKEIVDGTPRRISLELPARAEPPAGK